MRHGTTPLWLLAAVLTTTVAGAQDMPNIGFESVGRGRPLAVSVNTEPPVGPAWKGNAFARPEPGVKQELDGYPASAPPVTRKCEAVQTTRPSRMSSAWGVSCRTPSRLATAVDSSRCVCTVIIA